MPETAEKSLYERLGGRDAVGAAVEIFYRKVLADPRVNYFFDGIDMNRQRAKQKAFMTYAFGGAPNYSGQSMRDAHKRLVEEKGLGDEHFDAIAELLQDTLEELSVPENLTGEVMAIVESTRDDVLNR